MVAPVFSVTFFPRDMAVGRQFGFYDGDWIRAAAGMQFFKGSAG